MLHVVETVPTCFMLNSDSLKAWSLGIGSTSERSGLRYSLQYGQLCYI